MNKIEQAIRDLQLYIDVRWGGKNDMFNLALTALKDFCKLQQENEQLREALRKARKVLYNLKMDDYPGFSAICEALTAIDKVIGGKEDARRI